MSNNEEQGQETKSKTEDVVKSIKVDVEHDAGSKPEGKKGTSNTDYERGFKWWLRYIIIPLLSGGGIVTAIIVAFVTRPTPVAAQQVQLSVEQGKTEQVSIATRTLLITQQDLSRLDQNIYHIDENLEIAIPREPSENWEIDNYDSLPTIGLVDVPIIGSSFEMFRAFFDQNPPAIIGIRQRQGHEIVLLESSTIQSVPMNLNLFDNLEYVRAALIGQQKTTIEMTGIDPFGGEISDEMIQQVQSLLSKNVKSVITSKLPLKKEVYSGIYILPVYRDELEKSSLLQLTPESTLLDNTLQYLNFSGYFSPGSFQNLKVDQENRIASFNASVKLHGVEIDGRKTDAILNDIGFIVTGSQRAVFVNLIYLSADDVSIYDSLRDFLKLLRATG